MEKGGGKAFCADKAIAKLRNQWKTESLLTV
jgi:hypothetical protein